MCATLKNNVLKRNLLNNVCIHTTLLCVQYARQYYTYTDVCIQLVTCYANTGYGKVAFPIPALEGITLASSTIKLGQVGYIRCCQQCESKAKLQYDNFILLFLYYPSNSAYVDAICCCELVGRAASGTTHNHVHQLTGYVHLLIPRAAHSTIRNHLNSHSYSYR